MPIPHGTDITGSCNVKDIRALIVEDVFLIQRVIERFIAPYGTFRVSNSGKVALKEYAEYFFNGEAFNLVCLDIYLPEMNGLEVLKHIRDFENEIHLSNEERSKIIIISSVTHPGTIQQAYDLGCDYYITKPFSREDVVKALRKLKLIP